jgi:tetratricopeptide (TPR) repeat protein
MKFLDKFSSLVKKGKGKPVEPEDQFASLVKKEPGNARAHLKLAEIYQKKGEKQKAISEYLVAAEIFMKNNFYARAMAIYKQVPKQDPSLDHVYLKIADIYQKMGFLGDAFATYRILVSHYDHAGKKDKALEVMKLMADLDPRKAEGKEKVKGVKQPAPIQEGEVAAVALAEAPPAAIPEKEKKKDFFDLRAELEAGEFSDLKDYKEISTLEKIYGFEEIFEELKTTSGPSTVDPNFNFNMGVACREMEFYDDAIEQFQIAFDKKQNPFESANMLGLCYKEKNMWDEARQWFEKSLKIDGVVQDKKLEVKYELGLIYKELGKTEEALRLLKQISEVDQGFRNTKDEIGKLVGKLGN